MYDYQFTADALHPGALKAALQDALGADNVSGVSTYGPNRPFSVWLRDDSFVPLAIVVITTHDPVSLSGDKSTITADGLDTATITVQTFRPDAEPVTLLVNDTPVPVNLVGSSGMVQIVSDDPATITVRVLNPDNRTMDVITVEAL